MFQLAVDTAVIADRIVGVERQERESGLYVQEYLTRALNTELDELASGYARVKGLIGALEARKQQYEAALIERMTSAKRASIPLLGGQIVQLRQASEPSLVPDKDAAVRVLLSHGLSVPMKATAGRRAHICLIGGEVVEQ